VKLIFAKRFEITFLHISQKMIKIEYKKVGKIRIAERLNDTLKTVLFAHKNCL
jgi:hypothetical protein